MIEYLKQLKEEMPHWLKNHKTGVKPDLSDFFNSRVVYYPGAFLDGQPVKLFNSTNSAHCFMYVDYSTSILELKQEINTRGFKGYEVMDSFEYSEKELIPNGWKPHIFPEITAFDDYCRKDTFCIMYILKRTEEYGNDFGAEKFAFLYLKADAIATYDALFGNKNFPAPFCLLIEDYGLGGCYARFDKDGLLENVAVKSNVFPKYYLISEHSRPWANAMFLELEPQNGGMHYWKRFLYIITANESDYCKCKAKPVHVSPFEFINTEYHLFYPQ